MPKVSKEHLERRRQQILEAATECFARQGLHGTSMQDIFDASGLSAGSWRLVCGGFSFAYMTLKLLPDSCAIS
jgi:hypothetical protein